MNIRVCLFAVMITASLARADLRVHPDGYVFIDNAKIRLSIVKHAFPGFDLPAGATGFVYTAEGVTAFDNKKEWRVPMHSATYDAVIAAKEALAAEEAAAEALDQLPDMMKKTVGGVVMAKSPAEVAHEAFARNAAVYAYQNAYLLLCDLINGTNTHTKLAFEQLPTKLKAFKKSNKAQYEDLRDALLAVNLALIEKAGTKWWSACEWTTDPQVIAAGQLIYNSLMVE